MPLACSSGTATAGRVRSPTNSREGAGAPSWRVVATAFDARRDQTVELRPRWAAAAVLFSAAVLVMTPAVVAVISLFSEGLFDQVYGSLKTAFVLTYHLDLARLPLMLGLTVIAIRVSKTDDGSGRSSDVDAAEKHRLQMR